MNPFWSQIARELSPYVPGEQPRIADLVKLNTNESPFGPSPLALEAMRAAAVDTLRLYPDPEATELRAALAAHHGVKPEQVFASNGSDEVLEHACWCGISTSRARRPICALPLVRKTMLGGSSWQWWISWGRPTGR
jgi:histidinol-phosphate/aromatic aminotransferase/cobyric acid decarboxylase-like protein